MAVATKCIGHSGKLSAVTFLWLNIRKLGTGLPSTPTKWHLAHNMCLFNFYCNSFCLVWLTQGEGSTDFPKI